MLNMNCIGLLLIITLTACCSCFGEDAPKPLNPNEPKDAIQIIHQLTQDLKLTRREADIFNASLMSLNNFIIEKSKPIPPELPVTARAVNAPAEIVQPKK
jgi:hypothetical protein